MSSPRAGMVPGRVGIVGLGLVGGSVAKALAAAGTPAWGCDLDSSTERLALVETIAGTLDDAVLPTCELVVLAGWPASVGPWLEANADHLLVELDRMVSELGRYRDAIAAGDHEGLVALLEEGTRMKREADAL